jgi:hypothetical protein
MIAKAERIVGQRERFPALVLLLEPGAPVLPLEEACPGIIQVSEGTLNDTFRDLQRPGKVRFPQRLEVLFQRVGSGFLIPFACLELRVLLVPCGQAPIVDKSAGACCPAQIGLPLPALGSSGSDEL